MKKLLLILFVLLAAFDGMATHNRAGEITYTHVTGLTYEITVHIFADPNSTAFQRKEIVINYGHTNAQDSISQTITFSKIGDNIQERNWIARHTFPGPGDYTISVTDPNRNGGVNNIINSSGVPFYIESLIRISPIGSVVNNSPVLFNDPVDNACAGKLFVHNPGAVDPDGDSLAYRISPSLGVSGRIAPGFQYPQASTPIFVDPITGDLTMNVPTEIGLFNVAMVIEEYRNGILIGEVLRDLQIEVYGGCNNDPPVINAADIYCIEAGRALSINFQATDPNATNKVSLSVTGEIFTTNVNSPASFSVNSPNNPTNGSITWQTSCNEVRKKLYTVSIRAEDDGIDNVALTNLTAYKTIFIRVISPGPENANANPQGSSINLNWDNIKCNNINEGYFIYRRLGASGYQSDSCVVGVPDNLGYSKIATIRNPSITSYLDNNNGDGLVPGQEYCYLITKYFEDGDESYVSDEVCASVLKVIPIITNVSIDSTNEISGELTIRWSPPDTIDAIANPAPYRYIIEEQTDFGLVILDSTLDLNDTSYQYRNINTINQQRNFRISLYSYGTDKKLVGSSNRASSVFLNINSGDNQNELSWEVNVPWNNIRFDIFRKTDRSNVYDSLTSTNNTNYIDTSLNNGSQYCYYIRSIGNYNLTTVDSPLVNLSQRVCGVPLDTFPPCTPQLTSTASCEDDNLRLNWNLESNDCLNDIVSYEIYRSITLEGESELLLDNIDPSVRSVSQNDFNPPLTSIAGCYTVLAVDSVGNKSRNAIRSCVEYCPIYELPNVFTPNGDGTNDLYVPLKNPRFRYVDSVDFQVFNRWDQMVFQTSEPALNWNGTSMENSEILNTGVYFYICKVYESAIIPKEPRILKGTITILDSSSPNNFE